MLTMTERAVALACNRWAFNLEAADGQSGAVARTYRLQARRHAGRAMALTARLERETARKSPVKSITLTRAEGLEHECGKPVTVSTWDAASATLSGWAWTAPKDGGYDKCLFTVEWANGETYQGRFDLEYRHVMDARLEHQIGRFLRYVLETPGIAAAEMVETARRMLATVALG